MSKKIDENGNVPIIIDENTEPLINEAESAIKQFLKDAGNEEFDVERLKNEEITKIDLTTIVDEWKHDMELKNHFSDGKGMLEVYFGYVNFLRRTKTNW